jgi:hypothetical protein
MVRFPPIRQLVLYCVYTFVDCADVVLDASYGFIFRA